MTTSIVRSAVETHDGEAWAIRTAQYSVHAMLLNIACMLPNLTS